MPSADKRPVGPSTPGERAPDGSETKESEIKMSPEGGTGLTQAGDTTDMSEPAALDARVRNALGRQLSSYYRELVAEPVPDRLMQLLADLEERERDSGTGGEDEPKNDR